MMPVSSTYDSSRPAARTTGVSWWRRKTPPTKSVIRMPQDEKDMAPMAQPLSGRRNTSGISWQCVLLASGTVPSWHAWHSVSSAGARICKSKPRAFAMSVKVLQSGRCSALLGISWRGVAVRCALCSAWLRLADGRGSF